MTAVFAALLTGLIDYAGLFPPAGAGMEEAVRNYDSYRKSEHAWMLGRFIVPAARLAEFAAAIDAADVDAGAWRLSVLATAGDADAVAAFTATTIDTLEIRAADADAMKQAAQAFGSRYQLYFETPPEKWTAQLQMVGVVHARAKIRTGGEVESAIPAEGSVLQFLRLASERRIAFKATAGLHHPLRSRQRLTYKPDSASAVMHGFVNVFSAAALLWHEPKMSQEAAWILAERDADSIALDENTMTWHNSGTTLTAEQIGTARRQFAISFGSCSFTEPVADLKDLGWL